MRTLALLALLAVGARAQQSGPPQTLSLSKQNGGIATFFSGNRIGQPQSPYILNGYLDADSAVVKRNGYQAYGTISGCTSPVLGGWPYTNLNGTNYFFVQCGAQMYETNGNGSFSVIGSTLITTYPTRATTALGYEWFTDGADRLWYTDGVSTFTVLAAPHAKLIGTFQNRIVLSNIVGGEPGQGFTAAQSGTWLSGYNNGTDFSLPAVIVDTSAAEFPLNGLNDTRQVTCTFDGFKNVQILWNSGQMWGLYGTGNSSFSLQLISNEIGCTEQGSVQEYNGHLHWLSKRGIEDFDGTTINMISWPVQDQVQNLIALQTTLQSNTQTSQTDFQAGNLTASGAGAPMNATLFPGDIVPSSATFIDNSTMTYYTGSAIVNLSTVSTNIFQEVIASNTILGGDFASSSLWTNGGSFAGVHANGDFITCSNSSPGGVNVVCPTNAQGTTDSHCAVFIFSDGSTGDNCTGPGSATATAMQATLTIFDGTTGAKLGVDNGMSGASGNIADRVSGLQNVSISSSVFLAPYGATNGGAGCSPLSSCFYNASATPSGWHVVYNAHIDCEKPNGHMCQAVTFSNIRVSSYPATATYVSPIFDTSFSTPIAGAFNVTLSSNSSQAITFKEAYSSDTVKWTTATITNGGISATSKRYWRYEGDFTTAVGTQTAVYNGMSSALLATTTGYWVSQCIQPVSISSWSAIAADVIPNGGSVSVWMSTGASCALVTNPATANWTAQTLNTTISVATSSYVAERVLFNMDAATEVPHLQDVTINYVSGQGRPELGSTVYNKRYYIAYTTNTATSAYNDHVLVYDTNNTWTLLDDIYASSIFTSALKLYTGSSKSDGKVWAQDIGTVDNGSAFQFRVDTPDLDLGGFAAIKDLDDWWVEAQGTTQQAAGSNVAVNYFVDGGTTPYSAGTFSTYSPERGYLFSNGNFGLGGSPTKAHTLRLQYLDTSASPLRIYQTNLRYWTESLP